MFLFNREYRARKYFERIRRAAKTVRKNNQVKTAILKIDFDSDFISRERNKACFSFAGPSYYVIMTAKRKFINYYMNLLVLSLSLFFLDRQREFLRNFNWISQRAASTSGILPGRTEIKSALIINSRLVLPGPQ